MCLKTMHCLPTCLHLPYVGVTYYMIVELKIYDIVNNPYHQ